MPRGAPNLEQIKAWRLASNRVATAGQPTEDQLALLAQAEVVAVINLGLAGTDYALADESASVQALGMTYEHIPVLWESPTLHDWQAFRSAMCHHRDDRVLVHCAANMRATVFVALYGVLDLGWSQAQADALIASVWQPNPTWQAFMEMVMHASRTGG